MGEAQDKADPEGDTAELVTVAFAALALADRLYARLMEARQRGERLDPKDLEFARRQAHHAIERVDELARRFRTESMAVDAALGEYAAHWLAAAQVAGVG